MRKSVVWGGLLLALPALPQSLTLQDAVRQAARSHPAVEAAQARIAAAQTRPNQAKAGWMPQVNYQESVMRSNNPVYVFGSLLNQRRFSADRFQIDKLNNPEFVNNFQSLVSVDQNLYDFRRTQRARDLASTGVKLTEEEKRKAEQAQMAAAARAWLGVVLAREAREVAREGVRSAEADLARAEAVRASGRSTDADVLSVRVHLELMRDIERRRGYEREVALAALNEALGQPLDTALAVTASLASLPPRRIELKELESAAVGTRAEVRQTLLAKQMAGQQVDLAKANRLPVIGARMAFEADRGTFATQVGANWMFAASLKWNLFDGNQTNEKVREAAAQVQGAEADRRRAEQGVKLEVRAAHAALREAESRLPSADATVHMAEESLRITRNRYEAGLATLSDLLRVETAAQEARFRRLAAIHDQRLAAVLLEQALGRLNGDSDVLN